MLVSQFERAFLMASKPRMGETKVHPYWLSIAEEQRGAFVQSV